MKKIHLSLPVLLLILFISCKKETTKLSEENKLLSFSITGQLSAPVIDETLRKISPKSLGKSTKKCLFEQIIRILMPARIGNI